VPEAPKTVVAGWAPNAPERFDAAENHPSTARLMEHVPSTTGPRVRLWFYLVIFAGFAVVGLVFIVASLKNRHAGGFPLAFGFVLLGVGALLGWLMLRRALDFSKAPIVRTIALVADERVSVSGGKHASTTYYASFELRTGRRFEVEVDEELAAKLAIHDIGVLYLKDDELLGFERIPA
jgi:hypothetical protein